MFVEDASENTPSESRSFFDIPQERPERRPGEESGTWALDLGGATRNWDELQSMWYHFLDNNTQRMSHISSGFWAPARGAQHSHTSDCLLPFCQPRVVCRGLNPPAVLWFGYFCVLRPGTTCRAVWLVLRFHLFFRVAHDKLTTRGISEKH